LCFLLHNNLKDKEVFKEIKDTNGIYFVSNYGRVISIYNNKAKLLKLQLNDGYYYVQLFGKSKRVNRLVAEAFIPKPTDKGEEFLEVHHKDNNKLNNRANNLEWVTHKENMSKHFEDKKNGSK
jgi:hypothetical protein